MRPVREITGEEENFHTEEFLPGISIIKRNPIEPEPIGTIVLCAFRIIGYDRDCDGSLMAKMESIDCNGESTGWEANCIGLYPETEIVTTLDEWKEMFK